MTTSIASQKKLEAWFQREYPEAESEWRPLLRQSGADLSHPEVVIARFERSLRDLRLSPGKLSAVKTRCGA